MRNKKAYFLLVSILSIVFVTTGCANKNNPKSVVANPPTPVASVPVEEPNEKLKDDTEIESSDIEIKKTPSGEFSFVSDQSKITWSAKKVVGGHTGLVALKSGAVKLGGATVISGEAVMDMRTISDTDLQEGAVRDQLVNHLKSDDFFSVERFAESKIVITSGVEKGDNVFDLSGKLTIKDVTQDVAFPATIIANVDGSVTIKARLVIDRTRWGLNFRSGKFFTDLGNSMINDEITFEIEVVGVQSQK